MKIVVTALVLFLSVALQAQTLTEKDLLGKWSLVKTDLGGVVTNLKTGKRFAPGSDVGDPVDKSELEDLKQVFIVFKPGNVAQLGENNKAQDVTYTIDKEGEVQYISMKMEAVLKMQIALQDGLLVLTMPSDGQDIMYLEKQL